MTRSIKQWVVTVSLLLAACAVVSAVARPRGAAKPEDVIVIGRVVDLHSYLSGEYASNDPVKETRDNLRAGVPAGLEIEDGIVVIGDGRQNPARKLLPHAYKDVEITGKLYDFNGLLYVNMQDVRPLTAEEAVPEPEEAEPPAP